MFNVNFQHSSNLTCYQTCHFPMELLFKTVTCSPLIGCQGIKAPWACFNEATGQLLKFFPNGRNKQKTNKPIFSLKNKIESNQHCVENA